MMDGIEQILEIAIDIRLFDVVHGPHSLDIEGRNAFFEPIAHVFVGSSSYTGKSLFF